MAPVHYFDGKAANVTRYRVKASQAVVKHPSGRGGEGYFRHGKLIPRDTYPDEIDRLLSLDLIEVDQEGQATA